MLLPRVNRISFSRWQLCLYVHIQSNLQDNYTSPGIFLEGSIFLHGDVDVFDGVFLNFLVFSIKDSIFLEFFSIVLTLEDKNQHIRDLTYVGGHL